MVKNNGLTIKQEKFCNLFTKNNECFGSGVMSYSEAYGININEPGKYLTAKSNATRLLTNAYILDRIDSLLTEYISDQAVDVELAKVIFQDYDLNAKISAIREYNRLRNRIKNKLEINPPEITVINYQNSDDKNKSKK